ncbi:MAG: hypothetical protein ACI857_000517, partial [Arenicella sp.]
EDNGIAKLKNRANDNGSLIEIDIAVV